MRNYLGPYRKLISIAMLCTIMSGALVMVSPLLVRYAINIGLNPQSDSNGKLIGLDGNTGVLIAGAAAIVVFALGRGLAQFGQQYLGENLGQRIAYDIRNETYGNLQRLSYAYHDQAQTGQIMSRVTQDVESIRMFINMGVVRLIYIVMILFLAVGFMFAVSWQLALVSLASIPIITVVSVRMANTVRPMWMSIQQNQAVMTQVAEEGLSGIRVVKAFAREEFESAKFAKAAAEQRELSYQASAVQARFAPFMMGLGYFQIAVTIGVGSWLITRGTVAEADLIAFALWLSLMQLPIRTIGFAVTFASRAQTACERIFELIDAQSAVQEKPGAFELPAVSGHVRFEGVSFGYDNLSAVLADIDIDAPTGKVIALLGPTGSGKSTVVNLIPRFYDVTAGRITVDGHDVRDVTLDSLRRNIGIVQQDVFLFIGTIRENIAYGRPDATNEEIERAAKAARIHDFIVSLPYGYEEWVGERGVTLSGGQKQRIAIARTLLLDPRILIFDDSTSSVDTQTELLIQQALNDLMEGRTTFVIAQRLRTVVKADEIIVLDRGKVVQRGRHEELLKEEGLYQNIYELELKDQEAALGAATASANGHHSSDAHIREATTAPAAGGAQ
ncbi:MAG: ABC transporter ATP-binding protein [Dehalococcoidia bacterium]